MSLIIGGLQKTSLLDFPEKISAIVFTQGCNFRCGYCHNPELCTFSKKPVITLSAFFDFLKNRRGKLDGVVITGGEPTLHTDLPDFIKDIKNLGFAVKLDTNGTNPVMLEELIRSNLIDYIAMDIKSPLEKYDQIKGIKIDTALIKQSIDLIMKSDTDYEFRTTVVRTQLNLDDFEKIGELLATAKRYYLQKFIPSKVLNEEFKNAQTYTDDEFEKIINILSLKINNVKLRP